MAHYAIQIQISATRLPDPPPPQAAHDPGKDLIGDLVGMMRESMAHAPAFYPQRPKESGASMSKAIEVSAESFPSLMQILSRFDSLAEEIECAHPTEKW